MLKILIAEDEVPLLRGLKTMVEQCSEAYRVVQCVHNGKEAIEYLREHKVDLVLTDINMPLAGGIEIMEFLYGTAPDTVIVVISGYSDFEYARKAIRYGASDYLLKPVMRENLRNCLEKIHNQRKLLEEKEKEEALKAVVYKRKTDTREADVQMVYLCAGPFLKSGYEEAIVDCSFWKNVDIEREAKRLLSEDSCVYAFEKYQANERILLISSAEEQELGRFTEDFVEAMKEKGLVVTGIYKKGRLKTTEIPSFSMRLRGQLYDRLLFQRAACMEFEELSGEKNKSGLRKELSYFEQYKDAPEARERMLRELEVCLKKPELTQKEAFLILQQFFECQKPGVDSAEMVWGILLYSGTLSEVLENVRNMTEESGGQEALESEEDLMKQVERYVLENITLPLTVATLSKKFGLVAPYLSKLFKDYSGYTLSQYIQRVRIRKATLLLEGEEEILAKDVASLVGYSDPLYFSKVFKKKLGVYPSEYRKQKRKAES